MTTKAYVLMNVPPVYDIHGYLIDYLESVLEINVSRLELHPAIPDRALVIFKDGQIDLLRVNKVFSEKPIEDSILTAAFAVQKKAITVDRSFLEQHHELKSIMLTSIPIPESERVAVCFTSRKALDSSLTQNEWAGDIKMQPFYHNFHGYILCEGKLMSQIIEEAEKQSEEECLTKMRRNFRHHQLQKERKAHENEEANVEPKQQCYNLEIEEYYWDLLQKKIKDLTGCSVDYDQSRQILKVKSTNLRACRSTIDSWKADIIEDKSLEIPKVLKSVFERCHHFFITCQKDLAVKHYVQCVIKDGYLHFYGWDEGNIMNMKAEIKNRFMYKKEIPNDWGLSEDVLRREKKELEHDLFVHISWSDSKAKLIQIWGVYDDVTMAETHLKEVLAKHKIIETRFEFLSDYTLYVKEYCQDQLIQILRNVKVLFQGEKGETYCIEYSGVLDNVNVVTEALKKLMSRMKCEHIHVSKCFDEETSKLLSKAITNRKPLNHFDAIQTKFQHENKCCIVTDVSSEMLKQERQYKNVADASPVQNLTQTPQLPSQGLVIDVLSQGDITKEDANILVCPLHETKILKKLRISKAFLKLFPHLQSTVDDLDFSSCSVNLSKVNSSQRNCKFIAFMLLHPWSDNSPEGDIQQHISEVLAKADESGVDSVTFPPIGLGVVLKYPEESIGRQITAAIEEYQSSTSKSHRLNKITFMAGNAKLYQTLKRLEISSKDDVPTGTVNIKIIHCQDRDLASSWKEGLKGLFVENTVNFNSEDFSVRMEETMNRKLQSLAVIVKKETDSGTVALKFRGFEEEIFMIQHDISQEIRSTNLEKVHIVSKSSPPRGTLDFVKHAASILEHSPSYWKFKKEKDFEESYYKEVAVDDEIKEAIKLLLHNTWDASVTGTGNDAKGIPANSQVEFIDVMRIENLNKFKHYSLARQSILEKKLKEGTLCKSIAQVSAKKKSSELSSHIPKCMKDQLCHEINECYMLHGTKPEIVKAIKTSGCDPNVSSPNAMFGKGVYAAECSTKSDQYTDEPTQRLPSGSTHYVFLLRMLLGDIFVCDHTHPNVAGKDAAKLKRAPCKSCLKDVCTCSAYFYDSVLGEGRWIFREFIVYNDYRCYPEYCISYKRI